MLRNVRLLSLSVAISCALSLPVYADITINPGEELINIDLLENYDFIDNYGYLRNDGSIYNYSYYYSSSNDAQLNNWGLVENFGQIHFGENSILNNFGQLDNITSIYLNNNSRALNTGVFNNYGDVWSDFYYQDAVQFTNTGTVNNYSNFYTNIMNAGILNNEAHVSSNVIMNQAAGVINNIFSGFMDIYKDLVNDGVINNNGYMNVQNFSGQDVTMNNSGTINNTGTIDAIVYSGGKVSLINSGEMMNSGSMWFNTENFSIENSGLITNYGNIENYFSGEAATLTNSGSFQNHGLLLMPSMAVTNTGLFENTDGFGVSEFLNLATGIFNNWYGSGASFDRLDNQGVINNEGNITLLGSSVYGQHAELANWSEFNNLGSLIFDSGSRVVINNFGLFNQQGYIENQSDNIVINNYGLYDDSRGWGVLDLRNDSSLNNHGIFNIWNGLNGGYTSAVFNAGEFNSYGGINVSEIRNAGAFNSYSEMNIYTMNNTGELNLYAITNVERLYNASSGVINNNVWSWSWYDGLNVQDDFNNQGTINNGMGSRLNLNGYTTAVNSGTVNNDGGAEIHSNSDFNNSGTLNNKTNALVNLNGLMNTNSGAINNDGVVNAYMGINSSGVVAGNGEYYVGAMVITEAGTLAPGKSTGDEFSLGFDDKSMDIFGDLSLDGTLAIDFDWYYTGMNDVVNVYGNVMLGNNSVLDISFLGDNYFSLGQSFDLMFANDIVGDFGNFYYDALFDSSLALQWGIFNEYGQDILRVSVVSAVPLPAAVWMFMSGMIGLMAMGRRRKLKLH